MNELALFAGAGGGLLASGLLGWRTLCAVEIDDYARGVLLARQNDGIIGPFPIWDDVRSFDARPWVGLIDVVSGGFPCPDVSVIRAMWGRAGIDGEQSGLWYEFLRVIDECRPAAVWGENSPALKDQGLDQIVSALAERGYLCRWATIGAGDCGLPHNRQRLWFLATYSLGAGLERYAGDDNVPRGWAGAYRPPPNADFFNCSDAGRSTGAGGGPAYFRPGSSGFDSGAGIQPGVTGMADAVADRVDRLRAVGNGQVPRVAAFAFSFLSAVKTPGPAPAPGAPRPPPGAPLTAGKQTGLFD